MSRSQVQPLASLLRRVLGPAVLVGLASAAMVPALAADTPAAKEAKAIRDQLDAAVRLLDAGDREAATTAMTQAVEALATMAALPRRPAAFRPLADRAEGVRRRFEKAGIDLRPPAPAPPASSPAVAKPPQAGGRPAVGGRGGISFSKQVAPILARSCGGCHVAGRKGGFQMASYQGLMQSGMVQRGAGTSSRLVEVILTGDMPRGGGKISSADVDTLTRWIDAGAVFDAADPTIPLDVLARGGGPPTTPRPAAGIQAVDLEPGAVSFAVTVAPIFATHCLRCHGGDETENGFSMATPEALLRGGRSGVAVVSGSGASSLLVRKLTGREIEGQRMPLNAPPLSDDQIATLERWIDEGARLDMLTGKSPLDTIVAAGRTKSLGDSALADIRADAAVKVWRRAIPDEEPVVVRRPGICLIGNLSEERLEPLADLAERAAADVRRDLGLEEPLLKGGVVLFIAGKGYDYSTLWQTMLDTERPKGMTSHFGMTGEVVYAALLVPEAGDAADARASITEAVAGAAFAGRSVPDWFARGAGRAVTARLVREAPLVRSWRREAGPAAAMISPADLLGGHAADAVAAAAASGALVGSIGTGARLGRLLGQLDEGDAFDDAFAETFNGTPAEACATWAAKAASRR